MNRQSVLSALTTGVLHIAGELGYDTAALAEAAGIGSQWIGDPDSRVPIEVDLRLWGILSREPIGLEIGERLGSAGLGGIGYAMRHGGTVGDALAWLWRYRAVLHPDLVPTMERQQEAGGERLVFRSIPVPPFEVLREPVIAKAATIFSMMQTLTGAQVQPVHVTFSISRPDDPERYEGYFRCPVAWGGGALVIAFDAGVLDLPIPRADPRLYSYLAQRSEELLARLPSEESHANRVRSEIAEMLPHGEPRLADVASRLAMSERTLHRRLADEGTRFAALVDEARHERALMLLEDSRLSCSEVAFLLGYAEPATFFRAFKRWTGTTARAWRRYARVPEGHP